MVHAGALDYGGLRNRSAPRRRFPHHDALALHGAPGNATADRQRRAYITRWTGDDARYHPRPNIQPMLRDPGIAAGGPLDRSLFPVVRAKAAADA